MLKHLLSFFNDGRDLTPADVEHPENRFRQMAEQLLPTGSGGVVYKGKEAARLLGLESLPMTVGNPLYLYVQYGGWYTSHGTFTLLFDKWGYINFHIATTDRALGEPRKILINRDFKTRDDAVIALATALKEVDTIYGQQQPEYKQLDGIMSDRAPSC